MLEIESLVWDDWNVEHIARHDVTPEEVEDACASEILAWPTYRGRFLAIGKTAQDRVLTVVLEPWLEERTYYVITARPASRRERHAYRHQHEDTET